MNDSKELKSVWKWVGVAVIAAIPVFLIIKKIANDQKSARADSPDIFADELQG